MKSYFLLLLAALIISCSTTDPGETGKTQQGGQAEFVGREACKDCHQKEFDLYRGSDHDLAMDEATPATVLGDFDDAIFNHSGITTRFLRRDSAYFVHTVGEKGELRDYQIRYVFGHQPLQQYIAEFPNGRYQMLPFCWDTRPKSEGGQRWFYIYGDEPIAPDDILFWTRPAQNWNYMCSECHSTNVKKRYDYKSGQYRTSWSEIDVSCEACHGPASEHVAWARAAEKGRQIDVPGYLGLVVRFKDKEQATWVLRDPKKGTAERTSPRKDRLLIDMCGRCHSRRSIISEDYHFGTSLLNSHFPSLLQENLYFPDGQIQDEVYVYGSFLQSKMYMAGVVCTDCHEPHSGKTYLSGNALCYRCHAPEKFGVRDHHHHDPEKSGGLCVECHMPERTYMVVDPRRDHSMRIPRPDLSDELGTPNACTRCHVEKSNKWAADYTRKWYGKKEGRHYGEVFHAARQNDPRIQEELYDLIADRQNPPMVRATAVSLLSGRDPKAVLDLLLSALKDQEPLVRSAAVSAAGMFDPSSKAALLKPVLLDSVLLIRSLAAFTLSDVPAGEFSSREKKLFDQALQEYEQTQLINGDNQSAWLNLAIVALHQNDPGKAEQYYKKAIETEPSFPYSYINLADLYREQGRDEEGEKVLLKALDHYPEMAEVHHAMGLLYVRQKKLDAALAHLQKAVKLAPQNARFAYVYAVALNSTGKSDKALNILDQALLQNPYDVELLTAASSIAFSLGQFDRAEKCAAQLAEFYPQNENFQRILKELRAHSEANK